MRKSGAESESQDGFLLLEYSFVSQRNWLTSDPFHISYLRICPRRGWLSVASWSVIIPQSAFLTEGTSIVLIRRRYFSRLRFIPYRVFSQENCYLWNHIVNRLTQRGKCSRESLRRPRKQETLIFKYEELPGIYTTLRYFNWSGSVKMVSYYNQTEMTNWAAWPETHTDYLVKLLSVRLAPYAMSQYSQIDTFRVAN